MANNEEDSKVRKCKEDKTQSEQMLRDMSMNLERENNDRLNELMQVQASVKGQAKTLSNKQSQLQQQIQTAQQAQETYKDEEEEILKKRLIVKRFYLAWQTHKIEQFDKTNAKLIESYKQITKSKPGDEANESLDLLATLEDKNKI